MMIGNIANSGEMIAREMRADVIREAYPDAPDGCVIKGCPALYLAAEKITDPNTSGAEVSRLRRGGMILVRGCERGVLTETVPRMLRHDIATDKCGSDAQMPIY